MTVQTPSSRTWPLARKSAGVAAFVLLVAVAACSSGSGTAARSDPSTSTVETGSSPSPVELSPAVDPVGAVTHGSLMFDGRERTYRLYVPRALPDGPVPLFVGLHGGSGWGDQFATTNHIEGLAEANGFVVVHPDGVTVADGPGGVWNGGICCAVAAREGVDDVAFVAALIDELVRDHDVDSHRVFAFGHSNGGIMSYRLACELADRIVGVGVVAGTLGVETCDPTQPVSVIHVHGTSDENVPIAGGVGPRSRAGVDFPAPPEGFDTLAELDGCPDPDETIDGDITIALREPCDAGSAAAFVTITTANHAWPGGTPRVPPAVGEGYADYDATAELVTFLLSHPRP